MQPDEVFNVLVLSVVKHSYIARAIAEHPRYQLVAVADESQQPDWIHERNKKFAAEFNIPYSTDIHATIKEKNIDIAVISSEVERHCELSLIAANAGLHIIQDKPMSNNLSECNLVVETVKRIQVKFLMWNRNFLPAVIQAKNAVQNGHIGNVF